MIESDEGNSSTSGETVRREAEAIVAVSLAPRAQASKGQIRFNHAGTRQTRAQNIAQEANLQIRDQLTRGGRNIRAQKENETGGADSAYSTAAGQVCGPPQWRRIAA
jgi:hypothetical protein